MSKIRMGVVGAGHLGYHHARIYCGMEDVALVGVADPSAAARERVAAEFGTPVFESVPRLLEAGIDAVSVVTPTTTHHALTLSVLESGIHVLVEKPMAVTVPEAEEMVAVAARTGRLLQVGHIERFNGAVMALFEANMTPRFIECHRLSPYPGRGDDVSVVLDLMIHDLDIVLQLAASEVIFMDAVGVPVFSAQEDIANVRLRFASGCVANLTASRISPERMRKIRIFDPNAYVSTDYSAQEVLVFRKKPEPIPAGVNPMDHITVTPLPVRREEPLKLELRAFVDAVKNGTKPVVSGRDGLRAMQLAWRIIHALREKT